MPIGWNDDAARHSAHTDNSTLKAVAGDTHLSHAQIRRATRARMNWAILTSILLLLSVVFLILVELGNTYASQNVLTNIYFIKLDLSNIIPVAVPNAQLINSIARTLGLRDFYTVGLWSYCEGYNGQGVTACSAPKALFWFNPVEIIQNQLLAGASVALPQELNEILELIRQISNWMFGLFISGASLSALMIFIVPFSVYSRWSTLPIMLLTFLAALLTTVASIIATLMFIIMAHVFNNADELNIRASIGTKMYAFMWVASSLAIIAWLIQLGQLCCCASRRDVRTGRKRGSMKAYSMGSAPTVVTEKPAAKRGWFGKKKNRDPNSHERGITFNFGSSD